MLEFETDHNARKAWTRKGGDRDILAFRRMGEGQKDRCTLRSPSAWEQLLGFLEVYQLVQWVFEGQHGG